jgi:hypothetical protein
MHNESRSDFRRERFLLFFVAIPVAGIALRDRTRA